MLPLRVEEFLKQYIILSGESLSDAYASYLENNKDQHHYGSLETIDRWYEDQCLSYGKTKHNI
jgi:hypothetical protein